MEERRGGDERYGGRDGRRGIKGGKGEELWKDGENPIYVDGFFQSRNLYTHEKAVAQSVTTGRKGT